MLNHGLHVSLESLSLEKTLDSLTSQYHQKMERRVAQSITFIYTVVYRDFDMSQCLQHLLRTHSYESLFFWRSESQIKCDKISKQKVQEYLATGTIDKQRIKRKQVMISSVQDEKVLIKFIKCIQSISILCLTKVNTSEAFFKKLNVINKGVLRIIWLNECKIGNKLPKYIQSIPLQNISKIVIISDHLSNRGLKLLMKIEMPHLIGLKIWNTNVTLDSLKLLKRKPQNKLFRLSYFQHNVYSENLLTKTIVDVSSPDHRQLSLHLCNFDDPNTMEIYHFGYLAKYARQSSSRPKVVFSFMFPYKAEWTQKRIVQSLSIDYDNRLYH